MPSNFETGHAKNVSHFESLISFCKGYGSKYNPSREALKIANLQTQHTNAETSLDDVKEQKKDFDNATNTRKDTFNPLKKLSTRIVNALDATEATAATVDDAKTINRKIQGSRAENKPEPPPLKEGEATSTIEDKTISVSQQSYDQQIEHFASLIKIVASEPTYKPNEDDLTIVSLNKLLGNMRTTNKAVIDANTDADNSRLNRNKLLYAEPNGLVPIALDVKKYVKSVYSTTSAEYKQVSNLEFKTPDGL